MRSLSLGALAILALLAPRGGALAGPDFVRPFEAEAGSVPETPLDAVVLAAQRRRGIEPANPCSDEVFVRRVFLDVIGTLPEPREVLAFLQDPSPGKRAALVDALLGREEFADYWSLKWCDLLRVKSEFPVDLWPEAVQAYHRWIRDAIRENRPLDRLARELLTSSGSNFRVPPVNFYRAVQGRDPSSLAAAVALTFMATRIERWPETRRAGMAAFFSRIAFKRTDEWKEEIVCLDPAPAGPLDAILPDGRVVRVPGGADPRRVFADWLVDPLNPWFARGIANRVWSWVMGRGVVDEADDIRPDNPPSNPALLSMLEKEVVLSRFDFREILRRILQSRTYQQSSIPRSGNPEAPALFASYPVRRLDAEVLVDALAWIGGTGEGYTSIIPEPWTFIPADRRAITLADGSITSQFLEMFGRPSRDTGLESERSNQPTDAQRLHMLNSTDVQRLIAGSPRLRRILAGSRGNRAEIVRGLYLTLLARFPTGDEQAAAEAYLGAAGRQPKQAADDLAWALVNGREFQFRH